MSVWFVVFVLVWFTIAFFSAVLLGAYVGYCKEQKVNPVSHFNPGFLDTSSRKKDEETKGFYE
jgi:hypothetical protein